MVALNELGSIPSKKELVKAERADVGMTLALVIPVVGLTFSCAPEGVTVKQASVLPRPIELNRNQPVHEQIVDTYLRSSEITVIDADLIVKPGTKLYTEPTYTKDDRAGNYEGTEKLNLRRPFVINGFPYVDAKWLVVRIEGRTFWFKPDQEGVELLRNGNTYDIRSHGAFEVTLKWD